MGEQVIHHVVILLVPLHHAMVGWNKGPQNVLHQPEVALLLPLAKPLQQCAIIPDMKAPCEDNGFEQKLDPLRSKIKDEWDQINKPACPTTCSHCWGFLGVIGSRDEVPQLLCFFHAEFCMGRLSQSFFSTHTHTPASLQMSSRLQTQSLNFLPYGWTTSPWKQPKHQDWVKGRLWSCATGSSNIYREHLFSTENCH